MTIIKSNLPVNIANATERDFFESKATYEVFPLELLQIKNARITHNGIVIKKGRIVKESIYAHEEFFWQYRKTAWFNTIFRKTIKLNKKTFLLIHPPWYPGYYAWLFHALPRLLRGQESGLEFILILPENAKENYSESLKSFGVQRPDIHYIPRKTNLYVPNLLLPENPPYEDRVCPTTAKKLRKILIQYTHLQRIEAPIFERIFISRAKTSCRRIANSEKVLPLLVKYKISVVSLEDFSFWQQISIASNAKIIIGSHGAALTNICFMNASASVLELTSQSCYNQSFRTHYFRLASALNLNYYFLFCNHTDDASYDYSDDLVINLDKLEHIIQKMITLEF